MANYCEIDIQKISKLVLVADLIWSSLCQACSQGWPGSAHVQAHLSCSPLKDNALLGSVSRTGRKKLATADATILAQGVAGPAVVAELCSATLVMARSIIRSNAHDHLSVVGAHWFMHMSSIAVWGVIASTRQRAVLLI
ncbi:hypothetical protein ABBQ32_005143 [Trebouxia sp. C0010 RCD-2024]